MNTPQILAYSLAYIKAGYSIEGLIHELSEREGGMFKRIERAVKRGMDFAEALRKASKFEKDEILKEYFSLLASSVLGTVPDVEGRMTKLLNYSLSEERRKLKKMVKRFSVLSSSLIVAALSFAIVGALSAVVASVPLGPFRNIFEGVDVIAFLSLPVGMVVMLLIAFLGWWVSR